LDLDQVFAYAIDQEIKAMEFYERSASQTDIAEAQALFRSLARMEAGHRRALEEERKVLKETGQLKPPKIKKLPPEEETLVSLKRVAAVLKEANVILQDKHRHIQAELELAGQIQESFLPKTVPQLPNLQISVNCIMAERVGGDYYDFLISPAGYLHFVIADVSGKGMPAALLMAVLRILWRAKIREALSPDIALNELSREITAELQASDQFVTLVTCEFNPETRVLTWANAGHWPPLILPSQEADFVPMQATFLPLGLDYETRYASHRITLHPNDLVVLFSDGIIEAASPANELFGEERLAKLVKENRNLNADQLRDLIVTELQNFTKGKQRDDQTLIVIKAI